MAAEAIEAELQTLAMRAEEPLRAVVGYTVQGGKRARGLLLAASGEGWHLASEKLTRAAALVELLHAATLVQDDIFDRSSTRRGRAAAHCAFDPRLATLASDWMLTEATRSAYQLHTAFGESLSTCAQRMMAAEARELSCSTVWDEPTLRAHALGVSRGKTGELFGLAASAAALLAGDAVAAGRLHERGCELGLAFQYADDLLDLYGTEPAAGKDLARDLASSLCTLPVLDAFAVLPARTITAVLQHRVGVGVVDEFERPQVREYLLRKAGSHWAHAVDELLRELDQPAPAASLLEALAPSLQPGLVGSFPADPAMEAGRPAA